VAIRIKEKLLNTTVKAISRSMDLKVMTQMARFFDPTYDLHKRMKISAHNAIPNQDGAKQIVKDMRDWNHFPAFIVQIIMAADQGFHGKKYPIPHLREILKQMEEMGLSYDRENRIFIENPRISRSHNWGILREGDSYSFTLLKLDFVKNSQTVKKNPDELVKKCYKILREEFQEIVEFHNGRLWLWEGDGGLFSFHYQGRNRSAVCAAMEIQHRLFLFNHFRNPLMKPIELRSALLSRQCEYWAQKSKIRQSEAFKNIEKQESLWTPAGGVSITDGIKSHLDPELASWYQPHEGDSCEGLHLYRLRWGKE